MSAGGTLDDIRCPAWRHLASGIHRKADAIMPPTWTLHRAHDGDYTVLRYGIAVGRLVVHSSGYLEWLFSADGPIPSISTQRRLSAIRHLT